ncbi:response regulator transcription factor [candidate division KSB1 bacterium]|nr:response regulator transcription factor [candidate division KSB1 bacterium]
MNLYKAIIVDDEWLIRKELMMMLTQYPEIKVVGEATNIPQALALIDEFTPDVIFLDIQLQGATGFDLFEQGQVNARVIFVTAYDQYAIKAFEVNALDYLLKPITRPRLELTIQRILADESVSANKTQPLGYDDSVYILVNGALKFIKVSSIQCLIAEGNYSFIFYKDNKKELISKTLQEWEQVLPRQYFVRIHRSTIVNFELVEQVVKCKNYTFLVYLHGFEKPFMMSRRYAVKLKKLLPF